MKNVLSGRAARDYNPNDWFYDLVLLPFVLVNVAMWIAKPKKR